MRDRSRASRVLVLAALAGGLLFVSPAAADDASLFGAYNARQPELAQQSAAWKETFKRLKKSNSEADTRALMAINRRINGILKVIEGELKAQAPSSERGVKARQAAVREVRGWHRANRYENRFWRAVLERRRAAARRLNRRAGEEFLRAFRQGQRAIRHFEAVGLSSPERAITQTPAT
jgi:hypothetical protein